MHWGVSCCRNPVSPTNKNTIRAHRNDNCPSTAADNVAWGDTIAWNAVSLSFHGGHILCSRLPCSVRRFF
ncbi:hypothetical protein TNCV_4469561 [Trichonephila clavipes]|nr:hypothetical protein TNCV_4469561 [Trichonephila clavipes]